MSQTEEDRAAKAARAKAIMAKRRQQQKTVGGSRSASLASPPPSRSYTPAPAEPAAPPEDGKPRPDINDLFSPSEADANWIESLPRAEVPEAKAAAPHRNPEPSPKSPPPPPERAGSPVTLVSSTAALVKVVDDLRLRVVEQEKVISSLQAEKSTLGAFVSRLHGVQAGECQ
ncbi:hypothetical protein PAXINDRAFT_6257 [Paxillus involutus ATCC 200175]|nr:hypothetical protein PAXINDRAFT_6257 [Paxillus involutus ATCC 200175]